MQQIGGPFRPRSIVLVASAAVASAAFAVVVAVVVAAIALLLTARVTNAASPIDGVYRVTENSPTSQSVAAGACWATPMRTKLDPDNLAAKTSFYDVQITSTGNQVTFSQPGVGGVLLTDSHGVTASLTDAAVSCSRTTATTVTRMVLAVTEASASVIVTDTVCGVSGCGGLRSYSST